MSTGTVVLTGKALSVLVFVVFGGLGTGTLLIVLGYLGCLFSVRLLEKIEVRSPLAADLSVRACYYLMILGGLAVLMTYALVVGTYFTMVWRGPLWFADP